jgi:hypothetical protein
VGILIAAGGGFALAGMFAIPYIIISLYAEIFMLLIYYEIIELADPDEEEDP